MIVIAHRARGVGEGEGEDRDEREDEVETRHRGVEVPCGEDRVDAGASRAEVWAYPEPPKTRKSTSWAFRSTSVSILTTSVCRET